MLWVTEAKSGVKLSRSGQIVDAILKSQSHEFIIFVLRHAISYFLKIYQYTVYHMKYEWMHSNVIGNPWKDQLSIFDVLNSFII